MSNFERNINILFESINKRPIGFVLLLLILNIGLKFAFIGDKSIWIDEAYSASQSIQTFHEIISNSTKEENPPAYYLLLHYWVKMFGISETGIRSLSAILSICTAILIFFFARKHLSIVSAIFSSILFSLSNEHILYSHETRNYCLVSFLCILSFIFFFRIKERSSLKSVIALGIINALIIYTSPIAALIWGAQFICAALFLKSNKTFSIYIFLSLAGSLLLFLPWLPVTLSHIPKEGKFWLAKPTFYNFKGVFISIAGNKIILILEFLLICWSSFYAFRKNFKFALSEKEFGIITILSIWFLFPIIADYFISQFKPVFLNRYLLFTSIAFYLLVGFALDKLPVKNLFKTLLFTLLIITIIPSININPAKIEDWKNAVKKYNEIKKQGDITILSVWYTNLAFSYYYDRKIFADSKDNFDKLKQSGIIVKSKLDENDLYTLDKSKRVITIQSHQVDDDPDNTVKNVLENKFHIISQFQFEGVLLSVYERS